MRGVQSGLLAALTCGVLLLAACGGGETSGDAAWTKEDAQKILDSAAFSEELEELDLDTAWMLYGLGDAGLERENLTWDDCIVFGDSTNDVEMLSKAGFGVCMGNGCDAAKEAADYVCGRIEEDGLAGAIHDIFGI